MPESIQNIGPQPPISNYHSSYKEPEKISEQDLAEKPPLSKYGNPASYRVNGKKYNVLRSSTDFNHVGLASWYGPKFHQKKTSSGEVYDMYAMTAAHKTLPLPTYVRVTNLENDKHIIVKVNDRGPFHNDRIIDLSYAAARELDFVERGTAYVEVTALDLPSTELRDDEKHRIWLQLGAFSDKKKAEYMVNEVQSIVSYPVTVESSLKNQHPYYLVQLGPIDSDTTKQKITQQLTALGFDTPMSLLK